MKIFAFAETYPSPYKPYHDTQFEEFVNCGHELRVGSFGSHDGELSPAGQRLGLRGHVVTLPSVLRDVLRLLPAVLMTCITRPMQTLRRVKIALTFPGAFGGRLVRSVRAILLPTGEPDLCIVHNLNAQVRLNFLRAVYLSSPIVFYYHGGEVAGVPPVAMDASTRAFACADVVFTNTESSRQHAISRGCNPERLFICPVGFNLNDFPDPKDRAYRQNGVLNLLTVGRLSDEKGHMFALRAMAVLKKSGAQFCYRIVGDGPEEQRLREYVTVQGLGDCVKFLGKLTNAPLRREYCAADVLLLPSVPRGTWTENQACVVQEAMFARAAVAISRTGGVPESTAPEMLPFSFEPENPEQIAQALLRLDQLSVEELAQLGRAGREFTERRYDIRTLNRELLDTVKRVMS
jgi:colanic acid/amylovoran biosynthesis glycosyltransferase